MHILFFRCCLIWKSLLYKTCSKSQDKEVTVYVVICHYLDPHPCHYMSVALSFTHVRMSHNSWFLLNNSNCNKANHLKSIHQFRDNKRKTKFDFRLFDLFLSGVIPNELPINANFGFHSITYVHLKQIIWNLYTRSKTIKRRLSFTFFL